MNNSGLTWKYRLSLYIILALILFGVWHTYQVTHYTRYTIATTTRRIFTPRNGSAIEYTYQVNGNKHRNYGYNAEKYHVIYPNGRYFLKFFYKNPDACEILWDLPVPASILISPGDGWKKIP